jgi:hypothetical protein
MTRQTGRRAGDKFNIVTTTLGFVLVGGGIWLRAKHGLADPYFIALIAGGCLAIAPSVFLDVYRTWLSRGRNGGSDAPPPA